MFLRKSQALRNIQKGISLKADLSEMVYAGVYSLSVSQPSCEFSVSSWSGGAVLCHLGGS